MKKIFLILVLTFFFTDAVFAQSSKDQFMLYAVKGQAEADAGAGYQPVKVGAKFTVGASIRTLAESTAIVVCPDRSLIKLNPLTKVVLAQPAEVHLVAGALFTKVQKQDPPPKEPRFFIRTPTMVAGVRGTEFFTSFGGDPKQENGWLCVHEGEVEVTPNGEGFKSVSVKMGYGITIEPKKEIAPPQKYKWTEGLNWNMDISTGEIMDRTSPKSLYKDFLRHNYD